MSNIKCLNAYRPLFVLAEERCDSDCFSQEEITEFLNRFGSVSADGKDWTKSENFWDEVEEFVNDYLDHAGIIDKFFRESYIRGFFNDHSATSWKSSKVAFYQFEGWIESLAIYNWSVVEDEKKAEAHSQVCNECYKPKPVAYSSLSEEEKKTRLAAAKDRK